MTREDVKVGDILVVQPESTAKSEGVFTVQWIDERGLHGTERYLGGPWHRDVPWDRFDEVANRVRKVKDE